MDDALLDRLFETATSIVSESGCTAADAANAVVKEARFTDDVAAAVEADLLSRLAWNNGKDAIDNGPEIVTDLGPTIEELARLDRRNGLYQD